MQQQRYTSPAGELERAQSGPVNMRIREGKDGQVLEISLSYDKAEAPSRAYFADYVDVLEGRADITMLFGRLIPRSTKLRSQVEISFSRDSFVAQMWMSSRDLHATLLKKDLGALSAIENVSYSDIVHTSRANNVFMAVAGEESMMDFYYIAPSELHFVRSGRRQQVNLEPVIRISLSTALMLEFLDKSGELISHMPDAERIIKREEEASL